MKSGIWNLVNRVRREARRKPDNVTLRTLGENRTFLAFDWGSDTFVFERGIWSMFGHNDRLPIMIIRKSDFVAGAAGFVMTFTNGNHTVAAIPLMNGQFWNIGRVTPKKQSVFLSNSIVYANVVDDVIEISQRDTLVKRIIEADEWLCSLGLPLMKVTLAERTEAMLVHYRELGQEWRIRPLAWTRKEMEFVLRTSHARIGTSLTYFHNTKGVHFLTYATFHRFCEMLKKDRNNFVACLRELVAIPEGLKISNMRSAKHGGHHEVELFGLRPGIALREIIPALELLLEGITLNNLDDDKIETQLRYLDQFFLHTLSNRELADEDSGIFVVSMYKHLTGEIYHGSSDEINPAFDDRRIALPGATYHGGRPEIHEGTDDRTRAILDYVASNLSYSEIIESVNIYELRDNETTDPGVGSAREIVYKTNRSPLSARLIEKRLAQTGSGYGSYMMARVHGFRCLGATFGNYHLLARHDRKSERDVHYFIRNRFPGDAFGAIPRNRFLANNTDLGTKVAEDPEIILSVAVLAGDSAAQNMILKKYIPAEQSCRFGCGKEIIEFAYDVQQMREMPLRVHLCSVRGTLGWPDTSWTHENLQNVFEFYTNSFVEVLYRYWQEHKNFVELQQVAASFIDGFSSRTREMHWHYICHRDQFDSFEPRLSNAFRFRDKWAFALWALERQARRIDQVQEIFINKLVEKSPSGEETI